MAQTPTKEHLLPPLPSPPLPFDPLINPDTSAMGGENDRERERERKRDA